MSIESIEKRLRATTGEADWRVDSDGCCVYAGDIQVLTSHTGEYESERQADTALAWRAPADLAALVKVARAASELAEHHFWENHSQETVCDCGQAPFRCDVKDRLRIAIDELEATP